jgi:NAD(P)-dependent dehydrogenase (short-subunit alcohol dehydrogenase family)
MRTHLVTGAASGIGKATRTLLEARGDKVIGVDLRDAEICLDLADPTTRVTLSERLAALGCDRLDSVFASAGVGGSTSPSELVVRLNYYGAVSTLEQTRPLLKRSDAPRACVVSSIGLMIVGDNDSDRLLHGDEATAVAAFKSRNGGEAYAAAKRALAYWVRNNAADWAKDRIPLNAVAPGFIATPMTAHIDATRQAARLEELGQTLGMGSPEDVASIAAYLLSAENKLIAGQVIYIDGGHEAAQGARTLHTHKCAGEVTMSAKIG